MNENKNIIKIIAKLYFGSKIEDLEGAFSNEQHTEAFLDKETVYKTFPIKEFKELDKIDNKQKFLNEEGNICIKIGSDYFIETCLRLLDIFEEYTILYKKDNPLFITDKNKTIFYCIAPIFQEKLTIYDSEFKRLSKVKLQILNQLLDSVNMRNEKTKIKAIMSYLYFKNGSFRSDEDDE